MAQKLKSKRPVVCKKTTKAAAPVVIVKPATSKIYGSENFKFGQDVKDYVLAELQRMDQEEANHTALRGPNVPIQIEKKDKKVFVNE
uniref:Ty3-gypsy retrotransposon protein n=1 Tax=Rhabditophanes sp. KR3021 TaxID=114890 RepID=A0AC35TRF3_9BILA